MSDREQEFLRRLRATFKVEADEHVQAIARGLVELERAGPESRDAAGLEKIFRHAHSLKGAARAISLMEVESVCQAIEDMFAAARSGKQVLASEHFDALHRSMDLVTRLVGQLEGNVSTEDRAQVRAMRQALQQLLTRPESTPPLPRATPPLPVPPPPVLPDARVEAAPPAQKPISVPPFVERSAGATDTVRVATGKLDRLLLQAEELLAAKQSAVQRAADLREFEGLFLRLTQRWHAVAARVRRNGGLESEGDWNADVLTVLERRLQVLRQVAARDQHALGKQVNDLLTDVKELVMLPFATLADGFPKLVRDLSRSEGKDVDFVLRGGEVEVDKRVLEEIKDPLVHLLRNCIDHGVEPPAVRNATGKSARATLSVNVLPADGDRVEIRVTDDGAGIDLARVRAVAVRQGLISTEKAGQLSEADTTALIFISAISTSPIITELSGRGLGLAIVREKVEALGGRVLVETKRGAGTTFRLILPVALSTFHGVLVRVGEQVVVVPSVSVERVGRVRTDEIRTVENRETITLSGEVVPWARLATILELPAGTRNPGARRDYSSFVMIAVGDERIALAVDEVLHDEEVLVKRFARPLVRVRNVAAATVLASGRVAPILNPSDLVKSARRAAVDSATGTSTPPMPGRNKSILLVEDSITSRMLLKGILESAGYRVKTAADGVDALTTLKTEDFDLVVSDVEMPRMNGFDLTASIRADRRLAEKPVILVTALAKATDREHGIDVGASAYIVKGSFDQSNLLEAVRRLIR